MVCRSDRTTNEHVAFNVGEKGDRTIVPTAFGGHCYYVRKCMTGDAVKDEPWERQVDGIMLPQSAADTSLFVEVLAKGYRVGKLCSDSHVKLHKRDKLIVDDVHVGDVLCCPNMHPVGIKRSPLCKYEFFIEENVPLYAIEKENHE